MGGPTPRGICNSCGGETLDYRADVCRACWNARPIMGRKLSVRKHQLKKTYKLSLEDYDNMLKMQDNKCYICGVPQAELQVPLYIDHDRSCCDRKGSCGECIRGLLCSKCNFGLGQFNDDVNILQAAIDYVLKYKKVEVC